MRKRGKEPYWTNPLWHLLAIRKTVAPNTTPQRIADEYLLSLERIKGKKIDLPNREALVTSFRICVEAVNNYDKIAKAHSTEIAETIYRFDPKNGEGLYRYQAKKDVDAAQTEAVKAYRELRVQLEIAFGQKGFAATSKALDLPPHITDSLFRQMVTGNSTIGLHNVFIEMENREPKILIAASATRYEIDDYLTFLNKKMKLELPKSRDKLVPYLHKHSDGSTYVAVKLYKRRTTQIRRLMASIDRLQSKLPG